MTRSEERIDAIEREIAYECACATSKKLTGKDEESERHVKRMGLLREVKDILLAEQKRSEGCQTCKVQSCRNCVKVKICQRSYQAEHGKCAFEQNKFQPNEFCCDCGRDLTEGESV